MVDLVLGRVFDKRNVTETIFVNAIVKTEKNTQAGTGEDYMCRLEMADRTVGLLDNQRWSMDFCQSMRLR